MAMTLEDLQKMGLPTVNLFPDPSDDDDDEMVFGDDDLLALTPYFYIFP